MLTSLDLLIIVVMALAAVSLLAVAGMFLVKNQKVKCVCFYIVSALAVYIGYVGCRIMLPTSLPLALLALALAAVSIGAIVLSLVKKDDGRMFRTAQIMSSAALLLGMVNAFF